LKFRSAYTNKVFILDWTMNNKELEQIVVCPECDLLLKKVRPQVGHKACCPRCGFILAAPVENTVEKTMALSLTGLFLFPPAIFLPLLTLDILGLESTGSIFSSAQAMIESGFWFTGFAVFVTSIIVPFVKLLLLFLVSLQVHLEKSDPTTVFMFKAYRLLDEWGMLEVYMIGVLVTIIKLLHMAKIEYDVGFFCFIGLLSATLLSSSFLDENYYWDKIHAQIEHADKVKERKKDIGGQARQVSFREQGANR